MQCKIAAINFFVQGGKGKVSNITYNNVAFTNVQSPILINVQLLQLNKYCKVKSILNPFLK